MNLQQMVWIGHHKTDQCGYCGDLAQRNVYLLQEL